jgi:hypothetical protein
MVTAGVAAPLLPELLLEVPPPDESPLPAPPAYAAGDDNTHKDNTQTAILRIPFPPD